MRIYRLLFLLLLSFCISLIISVGVSASDWTSVDELPISPDQDLADLQDWLSHDPAQSDEEPAGSVDVPDGADAAGDDDYGIMPLVDTPVNLPLTGWKCQKVSGSATFRYSGSLTFPSTVINVSGRLYSGYYQFTGTVGNMTISSSGNRSNTYISDDLVLDFWVNYSLPDNVANFNFYIDNYSNNRFGLFRYVSSSSNDGMLPQWVQLIVNGELYGDKIGYSSFRSGHVAYVDVSELSGPVETIGYRLYYGNQTVTSGTFYADKQTYPFPISFDMSTASSPFIVYETGGSGGLIATIIEWLSRILNGITSIGSAIVALPGQIITLLVDALKSLFIPNQEDIESILSNYKSLFSERLGFIWQMFEFMDTTVSGIVSGFSSGTAHQFIFPGVSIELSGETYEIIASQPVSLDNAFMDVIRPVVGTIFSFLSVSWVFHKAEDLVVSLASGSTYFDWWGSNAADG